MPGRQSHGRPLLPTSGGGNKKSKQSSNNKKARAQSRNNVLDAFAIAEEQVPVSTRGVRTRDLEEEPERPQKRQRGGDDSDEDDMMDDDDDDLEDAGPRKKARNNNDFEGFSDNDSDGSDSEEWHVGVGEDDEDSELDSDEAFGESDEEKFAGYSFSGSSSNKKQKNKKKQQRRGADDDDSEEEEEEEDDLESLGSDAIDLATALDQFEEDDDEGMEEEGSGSDDESGDASSESEVTDDDDDMEDPSKLDNLQKMIAGFGDNDEEGGDKDGKQSSKGKLSLEDLMISGVKDEHIKKSLKLMKKEEKTTKPGQSKKLDIPLAKRAQDRNLREAAYQKTSQTLERWVETVKTNRRADHLMFPLAQNAHDKGLDNGELLPITQKTAATGLDAAVLEIMEASGLGPSAKKEEREAAEPSSQPNLSPEEQKELLRQKRMQRELHSREMARAKRIKKIKSKAYRRIHRKELLKDQEAMEEGGFIDSEEEREALDRRRAEERMGTRHRDSKWAKLGKKAGRAVWDENFKQGLTAMAREKEELRRRIEGKRNRGSDEDESDDESVGSESGDEFDERKQLLLELDKANVMTDDEPKTGLMAMKFMQRGEMARKQENDELVAQIRRELGSDDEEMEDEDDAEVDIGRRQYGMGKEKTASRAAAEEEEEEGASKAPAKPNPFVLNRKERRAAALGKTLGSATTSEQQQTSEEPKQSSGGAWSMVDDESRANNSAAWSQPAKTDGPRKSKKTPKGQVETLDLTDAAVLAAPVVSSSTNNKRAATENGSQGQAAKKAKTTSAAVAKNGEDDSSSDDEETIHLPMAIRDQELLKRAFAGEDVEGDFEREKEELEKEEDDKEVDNRLPGWGSWAGEGVSNRSKKRSDNKFVTKVAGIKKTDRKDFRLKGVIISEKRVKKVCATILILGDVLDGLMLTCPANRTTSSSRRRCPSRSSRSSSTSVPSGYPLGPSGPPRRRSRRRPSRGLSSSRASLRPCRSRWSRLGQLPLFFSRFVHKFSDPLISKRIFICIGRFSVVLGLLFSGWLYTKSEYLARPQCRRLTRKICKRQLRPGCVLTRISVVYEMMFKAYFVLHGTVSLGIGFKLPVKCSDVPPHPQRTINSCAVVVLLCFNPSRV